MTPKPDAGDTSGQENGDTTGTGGSTSEDGNSASGNGDRDQNTSGGDKSDSSGDNSGKTDKDDKDDSKDNTDQPSKPTSPSSTAKDPVINKKPDASTIGWGESQKDYNESDVTTKVTNREVRILQGSDEAALYKGQSVDSTLLFYALDTYVYDFDTYTAYTWDQKDYDHYIRIAGVSFDGGENWITQFPVTIPESVEDGSMYIKAEWRYSEKDAWEEYVTPYFPYSTRLFLLPKKLEKENEEIDAETLLNQWNQFPGLGTLKLYNYTGSFFQNTDEPLTALLPGWTENGEKIPWSYELTAGRHILEPQDLVPLDPMYIVGIQVGWFGADDRIVLDILDPDTKLYYLQTLTGLNIDVTGENESKYIKNLNVPQYIQSVAMAESIETDVITIPDTVLYIENNGKNLRVNKAFEVDAANQNYASEDGLLMNKERTEIIGIPYETEELTVGKNITKVNLTADNQLQTLQIKAEKIDEFPEIPLDNLYNCKVVVEDQLLDTFLEQYGEELTENQNCIASSSDIDRVYTMKNGMVLDENNVLYRLLGYKGKSLRLSSQITAIEAGAFVKAKNLKVLIWPEDCQIELNADSFADSSVEKIICQSQEQLETLTMYLESLGVKNIELSLNEKSDDGYAYYSEGLNGEITITLTGAPKDVKEFHGAIMEDGKEIVVNEIAANAFSNCDQLEWVILPEETSYIGYQAFRNCSSLQGILINTRDTITIGNQAFQGCDGLRFIASNALNGVMEEAYDPDITNQEYYDPDRKFHYFFVPNEAEGYGSNANHLSEAYGVDHYEICQTGAQGRILYAVDENGDDWLALRSGAVLDEKTSLPKETTQIYNYAFSGSEGTGDGYELNWEELSLMEIQEGAFYESKLEGQVMLGTEEESGFVSLRQNAFAFCEKMKSLIIKDRLLYLGQEMFLGDSDLGEVEFADAEDNVSLYMGMFNGCSQLKKLTLGMQSPMSLVAYASMQYQFNYDWTPEEEAENLQLVIPEGSQMEYLMNWRYQFAGSFGFYFESSYIDLRLIAWDELWFDYYPDNPPEDEVDFRAKQKLLEGENRLRKMTGLPEVAEPTDLYQYRQVGVNLTLTGVPSYAEDITLDGATMDFPEGWYLDAIGAGAFTGASRLSRVTIQDNLSEIVSGALSGAAESSDSVTLNIVKAEENHTIATLSGYTADNPFEFGIEENKIHIQVPEGTEADYIRSWTYPLAGYQDEKELEAVIREKVTEKSNDSNDEADMDAGQKLADTADTDPKQSEEERQAQIDQEVQDQMVEILLPAENRLRRMMGMSAIESAEDLISYDYIELAQEERTEETEEAEDTEEFEESEAETETETSSQETDTGRESEAESEESSESEQAGQEMGDSQTETDGAEAGSETEMTESEKESSENEVSSGSEADAGSQTGTDKNTETTEASEQAEKNEQQETAQQSQKDAEIRQETVFTLVLAGSQKESKK